MNVWGCLGPSTHRNSSLSIECLLHKPNAGLLACSSGETTVLVLPLLLAPSPEVLTERLEAVVEQAEGLVLVFYSHFDRSIAGPSIQVLVLIFVQVEIQ